MSTAVIPQPLFAIGDTVYGCSTNVVSDSWPCPDCAGSNQWTATSAVGEQFKVECPRCKAGGYGIPRSVPQLSRRRVVPSVQELTVGSIRIDTADDDHPVAYMCTETGVGSGRVYYEGGDHGLFATEAEAQAHATLLAAEEQSRLDTQPEALRAAAFAGITLKGALPHEWRDEMWTSWRRARHYREAMEEIVDSQKSDKCNCEPIEDLAGAIVRIQDALEDRSWLPAHPLDALIAAAVAVLPVVSDAERSQLQAALDALTYRPGPSEVAVEER